MDHDRAVEALLKQFAEEERLPDSFLALAQEWYWPLSRDLIKMNKVEKMRVLGISGSQGSGKSTLAKLLCCIFEKQDGLRVVSLSLDDFYLPLADRQSLAKDIHPLLQTRGVPGTHDIRLAIEVINNLLGSQRVHIPRFDKANDDRLPPTQWDKVDAPVDLIIMEGWCLSLPVQDPNELELEQNPLEAKLDSDGAWRQYVNHALEHNYPSLFKLIDYLVYLKSPDFDAVCRWRGNQEQKLSQQTKHVQNKKIMDKEALDRFMQHYQRLTLHGFSCLPLIADVTFYLDQEQQIYQRSHRQS